VDLNVFPGELLADPAESGIADHLQRPLPLGYLNLLLEKGVDAKGHDIGVVYRHANINLGLGPGQVAGVLGYSLTCASQFSSPVTR